MHCTILFDYYYTPRAREMRPSSFDHTKQVHLLCNTLDAQDKPKISSKGGDLHLSSGAKGNIVFERSQQGRIFFGTDELVGCGLMYRLNQTNFIYI